MKFDIKIFIILAGVLILANLIVLDFLYWQLKKAKVVSPSPVSETVIQPGETVYQDRCGAECQQKIAEEVSRAMATVSSTIEIQEKEIIKEVARQATPQPQIAYIPLGSGGSTINMNWTDLAGSEFVFDLADYSAHAKVYWQGNIKAKDLNSRCYARIYDSTNLRAVDFSEQSTAKTTFETLTSSQLMIWAGENHHKLQIKSLNGSMCSLESAKLKVIY